jgi:hypothetical protein
VPPAPNPLIYFCISLSFGRFPILEWFKRVVNLLSQLGHQVCVNNTKYKALKALILKNVIFHEKMAWIHWILKKKKSEVKFPGFYIGFLIDSQDLKMIIFNKNSYLVDTQIWLSFHLDNYNFSWITKLKEKEHSLWALWAFLVALVGYTNWRDVT